VLQVHILVLNLESVWYSRSVEKSLSREAANSNSAANNTRLSAPVKVIDVVIQFGGMTSLMQVACFTITRELRDSSSCMSAKEIGDDCF